MKKQYHFVSIPKLDLKNSYDNIDFYGSIMPIDYLIYTLVYEQNKYKKACLDAEANRKQYASLLQRIKEECHLGQFDLEKKFRFKNMLKRMERNLFVELTPRPQIQLNVRVTLIRTNINGAYQERKSDIFDGDNILTLIRKINQKRGSYYLDANIFQAICRVERGKVSNRMRFAIYQRDGNRCVKCGSRHNLEIDHIIPISKGGKSTPSNLQTLCHNCNKRKGSNIE